MQKKAAIIQDISCLGKCSAGVALPVVSHFNIECALLPTALLSAHTGFRNYTCIDLTDNMKQTIADWKKEGVTFDGVYSVYMLNEKQIELSASFIDEFANKDAFVLVDPVMGDDGKAYSMLSESYGRKMKQLISRADVITPNLTEAALLLERDPVLENYDEKLIEDMLRELKKKGAGLPMITGVSFEKNRIGAAFLKDEKLCYISSKKFDGKFCGTGDTFASVVFGSMMNGVPVEAAVEKALSVVEKAILNDPKWYGISFESALCDI